jgi:Zn-finger nucleic acid-binding protein
MCGAAVSTDAPQCLFCEARLATVSCPACFGMMFIGSRHCPRCGAKAARVEEADEELAKRNCPRCNIQLECVNIGDVNLRECASCAGLWVDVSSFEKICADREQQSAVLGAATPITPDAKRFDSGNSVKYVPCPECNQLMNRVNFARCSGVVVDVCKGHGTWFDRDEMQQIVEFIRSGGLEASRTKEKQQLSAEWQKLRREQLAASRGESTMLGPMQFNADHSSVVLAAKGLLKILVDK